MKMDYGNDYYHRRLPEILKTVKQKKHLPEPVDVLPKLPVHETEQYRPYSKDGIIDTRRGYHEVWKNGKFITNTDTKGEAWRTYWG